MYRALIVCNYRFPAAHGSLRNLQGPKRDGLLLRDALTDHDTGLFEKVNVGDPLNDATSGEILEAVEEFFESAEPDDTLLFYYSGHGRSRDQELYLCAQNTDPSRLRSTAVSGRSLKDIVGSSSSLAQAKILVFDCCYSALFKGDDDREITELFGTGRYVLAAASAAERAPDGAQKGEPSPFTKALADALTKEAEDLDGDGKVDLDDVYRYLKTISFDGARPHQNFEGAGSIPIARRAAPAARDAPRAGLRDDAAGTRAGNPHDGTHVGRASAARNVYVTYPSPLPGLDVPYLDRSVPGASFSPALVAEFRRGMRDDVRGRMPDSLTDAQFLDRAGLLTRDGSITYAGLLLFGTHPTQALPSAVVQCVRFHGTTNTASREITDFHDPIPQLIARAYDFVAGVARIGDTPTDSGPRAEPAYKYPMVAVREIIANAVVHRDYENQKSCVQIHAFEDRIEVHSPGAWQGAAVALGTHPLGELARMSERRNFRIAQPLTWSRLMEGAGTGVARSVEECGKAGAQEPLVVIDESAVKVVIFPQQPPQQHSKSRTNRTHIWGSEIPFRNPYFTGREAELRALRDKLQTGDPVVIRQPPSVLYGLGGIGKTQLATEYVHRYGGDYEVVWWVRSDQEDSIQASLVSLGTRLRLSDISVGDRDRSLRLVIDALQAGDPYSRWLLVFDDATQPEKLRRYIPQGGHIIVTSRINEWRRALNTDGIEVGGFARTETVRFLRGRVPQLAPADDPAAESRTAADADQLAEMLGDLPLAAEHAASYLAQTGTPVADYVAAFERDAHALLARDADMFATNRVVSTTWSVTQHSLSPEARELFQLLAFFAAEPISEENLLPGQVAFDPPLSAPLEKVLLSRTELERAQRELVRFSLISVYGQRNASQLHRVVQAVTRARIEKESPDLAKTLQAAVFALLAATDPESPEREQNDPIYDRSIQHLIPTGALQSDNERLRNLIINQVRRLRMRGENREALSLGDAALSAWKSRPDDIQTLAVAAEVGMAKRELGQVKEAFELNSDTLRGLRDHYGTDDDTYLLVAGSHSEDLRMLGKYEDALAHDRALLPAYDRVFSPGQFWPLNLRTNIAIDLRCVGQYAEALKCDTRVAAERERNFGASDRQMASSKLGIARDLRHLGRYKEALQASRDAADFMEARNEPWNFLRLEIFSELAVSLRRSGYYQEAHNLAEDVYRRYVEYAGEEHRATLVMATSLICDRRLADDLPGSQELAERATRSWGNVAGYGHPNTLVTQANLAVTTRLRGDAANAHEINQAVLADLRGTHTGNHPHILAAMTNLASDLSAMGNAERAREIGEQAAMASKDALGPFHPSTLAAFANLSIDLVAAGDTDAAQVLEMETLTALEDQLSPEHPLAVQARRKSRIDLDIVPVVP